MSQAHSRRTFLAAGALGAAAVWVGSSLRAAEPGSASTALADPAAAGRKIPVILDTDIGDDIDDTWALALLLQSPECDVRLVVSDAGNDLYRARIIGKMLEVAGRTDIPIGIGLEPDDKPGRQSRWVGDYALDHYPGKVHRDGVAALVETIRAASEPVTLVAIGPTPNVAEALRRAPDIAQKARFVGMHGSVRRGYGNSEKISAEYNVVRAPRALQAVFAAPWDITLTPLDTCGVVHLTGEKFQKIYRSDSPLLRALMENYQAWRQAGSKQSEPVGPPDRSSTLFDTVAVWLALSERFLEMETLGLRVTDDGFTKIDPTARPVRCALRWTDLGAFEDALVTRLLGERR